MPPVYLITGAQGFIGSWIIKKLKDRGLRVIGMDMKQDHGILKQVVDGFDSVEFHYGVCLFFSFLDCHFLLKAIFVITVTSSLYLS
jgi:nucleoside-diphosphate-sugar epimerase